MSKAILIVDNEKNLAKILSCNLKKQGYNVAIVNNGDVVPSEYKQNKPALILIEVMLPLHDGFEVCKQIRVNDNVTSIFVMSARDDAFDKAVSLKAGADDYIAKLFSIRELLFHVTAAVGCANARAKDKGNESEKQNEQTNSSC